MRVGATVMRWLLVATLLCSVAAPVQHEQPMRAAAEAVGTEETVESLLRTVRLEAYVAAFAAEGYEYLSDLQDADTVDLEALVKSAGMRKPERKRFLKALSSAVSATSGSVADVYDMGAISVPTKGTDPAEQVGSPDMAHTAETTLHTAETTSHTADTAETASHTVDTTQGGWLEEESGDGNSDSGGWSRSHPASLEGLECSIERRSPQEITPSRFEAEYRHKKPLVFSSGLLDGWKATSNWQKEKMIGLYGNATAKMGSSAELVFSAGDDSVRPVPLAAAIERMSSDSGLLMFDNEWLIRQAPEILGDFEPAPHFAGFSPRAHEADVTRQDGGRDTWNMISLGGSGSGLPWHTHGETWIATVYGRKAWFVYAPGDAGSRQRGSPLHDASTWFAHTLPTLSEAERPYQCVQQPGEVVYLPAGWAHLTVNLDETIGAGAQSNMRADDVNEKIKPAADAFPGDPEAKMYMAFYLQQKLAQSRGVGEMRDEAGFGEGIRRGTKRGSAKRKQDQVLKLLQEAAEHHPYEIRGKLQLADLHARLGKHKQLSIILRSVEDALIDAEAESTQDKATSAEADAISEFELLTSNVAHPLLLAEAWYRLALVYRHHEKSSYKTFRAAHRAAAASVRISPYPHVEAVLLAYEMALVLGDEKEIVRLLAICEGSPDAMTAPVPGCKERLEALERGEDNSDTPELREEL
jgi:ribosomal protein L16 Arg81 hydroxylase